MKATFLFCGLVMAVGVSNAFAKDAMKDAPKEAPKDIVIMPASDMTFTEMASGVAKVGAAKPPQMSALWGDMMKSGYGAIVKLNPAEHALHTHTSEMQAVVISGTFYIGADMASAKKLGPGSYFRIPGGWKHVSGCEGTTPCVLFQESPGKFDMVPVK